MQAHCGEIFVKVLSLVERFLFVVGAAIYICTAPTTNKIFRSVTLIRTNNQFCYNYIIYIAMRLAYSVNL